MNPIDKERKSILDFCYVPYKQGAIPVLEFLNKLGIKQEKCGLSKVPHMHEVYGLYYDENQNYNGLIRNKDNTEVCLSSIAKNAEPLAIMSYNKTAYSKYCKDYKEYWEWVEKRNNARYKNTVENDRNYDSKNMMHTFRLLNMAKEIGLTGKINVNRTDRDFLLGIKYGKYQYNDLVTIAEDLMNEIEIIFDKSDLPDAVDIEKINQVLVEIREKFYTKNKF